MLRYGSQTNKTNTSGTSYTGTIDKIHQEVHEGKFFTYNYLESGVLNNGFARIRLTTTTKAVHVMLYLDIEAKVYFKTRSGTTYTVAGTLPDGVKLTAFNRRTNSSVTATAEVRYNPTVNVAGALRGNRMFPGGTGGNSVGLSGGERVESVIAAGTDILLEVQNVSGQTRDIGIIIEGYEE